MKFDHLNLIFDTHPAKRPVMNVRLRDDVCPDQLFYGTVSSPFGEMTLIWCEEGLCYLGFEEQRSLEKMAHFFPNVSVKKDQQGVRTYADKILAVWRGEATEKLELIVSGTEFQKKVWECLLHIPCGHVVSYGAVAEFVGRSTAVRAVGSAVGANPVSLLIPCHRVIQKNGSVCHYGWGDAMKQKLLKMEVSLNSENPACCNIRQAG